MITKVAVVVDHGVTPFELGVLCEAWGVDRSDDGVPRLELALCAPRPGRVTTSLGFGLEIDHGLASAADADLVCVPAFHTPRDGARPDFDTDLLATLRDAAARGATVLSVCSGAFALGEAGLLDGRRCTTHWKYTSELAERFPSAEVVPEVLYVDDDGVVTSAGSAAGLDACLHLWRREFGATIAGTVARRMVVPPQREGGQAQFIPTPVPDCDGVTMGPLLEWMLANLGAPLDVPALARKAHMSERSFARRFRAETGTTPHAWLTGQRLVRAEQLLEATDWSVDRVAEEVGFGNAAALRHHFTRSRGVSPQAYRRSFACPRT